jgi:hypothetical protein
VSGMIYTLRRLSFGFAAILAVAMGSGASASAADYSGAADRGTVQAVTCSENWTGSVTPSQTSSFVVWNANSCGWQIRVHLRCVLPTRGLVTFANGGWVRAVGLHSGATCPSAEPVMTDAYAQYRVASGDPITTVRYWT